MLEPLSGYLARGEKLISREEGFDCAWNFGPAEVGTYTVQDVAQLSRRTWPEVRFAIAEQRQTALVEAPRLTLDSSLARDRLGWHSVWSTQEAVRRTVQWYRLCHEDVADSRGDLAQYCQDAEAAGLGWCR
ncbi:MAG: hypothetical protein IJJ33_05685 [Victivallales bacterium]|nr:hypothetical protein [Victivallales bacterium]